MMMIDLSLLTPVLIYRAVACGGGQGGQLPPLGFPVFKNNLLLLLLLLLLKYSAYSLVDTLIVDIVGNVW